MLGQVEKLGLARGVPGDGKKQMLAPGGQSPRVGAVRPDAGDEIQGVVWVEVDSRVSSSDAAQYLREVRAVLEAELGGDLNNAVPEPVDAQPVVPWDVWDARGSPREDHDVFVPHLVERHVDA